MKIVDFLTIAAILLGPIFALGIQRSLDLAREVKERRLRIFRTLMSTRATTLAASHVEALNMINVAFYGTSKEDKSVIAKWAEYLDHLCSCPQNVGEANYQSLFTTWNDKRQNYLVQLLELMGIALGYEFDPLEIKKGVYRPAGHNELESEQEVLRKALVEVFTGKKALPIKLETEKT